MTSFALIEDGLMVDSDGNVYGPRAKRKLFKGSHGYLTVHTARRTYDVHRLIAKAFCPNPDNKEQVAHWDGDKSNNQATNLRWASSSENCLDKRRHKTNKGGTPKLDWDKVKYIRDYPRHRGYQTELANKFGVHQVLISMVVLNKIWKG